MKLTSRALSRKPPIYRRERDCVRLRARMYLSLYDMYNLDLQATYRLYTINDIERMHADPYPDRYMRSMHLHWNVSCISCERYSALIL